VLKSSHPGSSQELELVAPVLTPKLHRSGSAEAAGAGHGRPQEGDERLVRHLTYAHLELAMGKAVAAADEA
jgi:hypothetical protein